MKKKYTIPLQCRSTQHCVSECVVCWGVCMCACVFVCESEPACVRGLACTCLYVLLVLCVVCACVWACVRVCVRGMRGSRFRTQAYRNRASTRIRTHTRHPYVNTHTITHSTHSGTSEHIHKHTNTARTQSLDSHLWQTRQPCCFF